MAILYLSQSSQSTQSFDLDCWEGNPDRTKIQLHWKFAFKGWTFVLIFPLKKLEQINNLCDLCGLEQSPAERDKRARVERAY